MLTRLVRKVMDDGLAEHGLMVTMAHPIYLDESEGPFRCDRCTFANADATRCSHPEIIKLRNGIITPASCSDFFHKRG